MDWRCDLYLYYSVGDYWSINVAGRRRVLPDNWPETPPWPDGEVTEEAKKEWIDAYLKAHREQMDIMDAMRDDEEQWVDIPEPWGGFYAGISDGDQVVELLEEMKAAGIVFPEGVIEAVREEWAEMQAA